MIKYFMLILIVAIAFLFVLYPYYMALPWTGMSNALTAGIVIGLILSGIIVLFWLKGRG